MKTSISIIIILLAIITSATPLLMASGPFFKGLGDLPGGEFYSRANSISSDGNTVVGVSKSQNQNQSFVWTEDSNMFNLGDVSGSYFKGHAIDVSADGSAIIGLGDIRSNVIQDPYIYKSSEGLFLLDEIFNSEYYLEPYAISADANVIVGRAINQDNKYAPFRWAQQENVTILADFTDYCYAADVSADGSVVVGQYNNRAFKWTQQDGFQFLAEPYSAAQAISPDAAVIVGRVDNEPYYWKNDDTENYLDHTSRNQAISSAYAAANAGNTIVGRFTDDHPYGQAFIWRPTFLTNSYSSYSIDLNNNLRNLKDVLQHDYNLDLDGWILRSATDVSADGTVIVGNGIDPNGNNQAWIAKISDINTPIITSESDNYTFTHCPGDPNIIEEYLYIWNIAGTELYPHLSENADWIAIHDRVFSPKIPEELDDRLFVYPFSIDTSSLDFGKHQTDITVHDANAYNSPYTINVTLYKSDVPAIYISTHTQTIQQAIDNAKDGDTIIVDDGIYQGDTIPQQHPQRDWLYINFKGKTVTVKSLSGPENCILKAPRIYLFNAEDANSILTGFTIDAGKIAISNSEPTIENCIIKNAQQALYLYNAAPKIDKCIFTDNNNAVFAEQSSPLISNCLIINSTNDAICLQGGYPFITNCTIANNQGLAVKGANENTIVNNSIVRNNQRGQIYSRNANVTYSNIERVYPNDFQGIGNIDAAPAFLNPDANDFRLNPGSPCIDTADPNADPNIVGYTDIQNLERFIDGNFDQIDNIDMGAYEFHPEPLLTKLTISPNVINIRQHQKRLLAIITLPEDTTADDVDMSSNLILDPGATPAIDQFASEFGKNDQVKIFANRPT